MARFVASPSSLGWPRQGVILRLRLPLRERLLDEDVDCITVLGMHHDERTCLGGNLHRPEERLVVDHESALVGHEELVGRDPLIGE